MSSFAQNVTSADFWLRLVYTLLFGLAWQVAEVLLLVVALVQLAFLLFTGAPHPRLSGFGSSLSQYARQIGRYVSQITDQKPWPFVEWPVAEATSATAQPGKAASEAGRTDVPPQP